MSQEANGGQLVLVERPARKRRRQSSSNLPSPSASEASTAAQGGTSAAGTVPPVAPAEPRSDPNPSPEIPSYEDAIAMAVTSTQDGHDLPEDPDMLLALQLSMADSDNEDIDLSNFSDQPPPPRPRPQSSSSSTQPYLVVQTNPPTVWPAQPPTSPSHSPPQLNPPPPANTDLDNDYYNDDVIAALYTAPQPGRLNSWTTDLEFPRDRYDVAGISTYRVDPRPRGPNNLYSRFRLTSSGSPLISQYDALHELNTARGNTPHGADTTQDAAPATATVRKPNPLDPTTILSALQKRHPVLNPESGAPLINVLDMASLLCVTDHLYFPDIFALALSCQTVHGALAPILAARKRAYRQNLLDKAGLRDIGEAERSEHGSRRWLCQVCLYELPSSYFRPRVSRHDDTGDGHKRQKMEEPGVCTDCVEFREKVEALEGMDDEAKEKARERIWLVWRPSRKVIVEGEGGLLWYRRRE